MSVLTHTSPVWADRASIAASLSTTNVWPIANGGITSFEIFPFASRAATQFATFFSFWSMNWEASASGHRTRASFTVNVLLISWLPPTYAEPSTFKSWSISTPALNWAEEPTHNVPCIVVSHQIWVLPTRVVFHSTLVSHQILASPVTARSSPAFNDFWVSTLSVAVTFPVTSTQLPIVAFHETFSFPQIVASPVAEIFPSIVVSHPILVAHQISAVPVAEMLPVISVFPQIVVAPQISAVPVAEKFHSTEVFQVIEVAQSIDVSPVTSSPQFTVCFHVTSWVHPIEEFPSTSELPNTFEFWFTVRLHVIVTSHKYQARAEKSHSISVPFDRVKM